MIQLINANVPDEAVLLYPPGIALHPCLPSAENELRKLSGMIERGQALQNYS